MSAVKFSFYNIIFDVDGQHYIYNTLSTALAQLDDKTYNAAIKDDAAQVDAELVEEMLGQRFLADITSNEAKEYLYFYNHIRFGRSAKTLAVNVLPTYDCNLACPYCLQGQNKADICIENKEIDKILVFVANTVKESQATEVAITKIIVQLYGGEPMLQKPALVYIADGFKKIADEYKCEIIYSMTSNLTLLDDDMLKFMQKYQINVQVSIDGTKEQHDKRRIFINGAGTYDIILKNLKRMQDANLKNLVVIRLNIDKNNLADADKIFTAVQDLSDDVYFGFLDTFQGNNDQFSSQCVSNLIHPKIVTETFNDIYQKYGRAPSTSFGKMSPCAMVCENSFFIDAFLNVYKCEMLLNKPENRVGFIDDHGCLVKTSDFYKQMNRTPQNFPECMTCKLLPLCAGGCAGKSSFKCGDINKPYCMFSEESLITFITDYIKRVTA